jgi:hypothetical protein
METLAIVLQVVVGFGIYNVWFVRPKLATAYRGKGAQSLKEEFAAYGLPGWFMYVAGFVKVLAATALIVGVWVPMLVVPGALALVVMMTGAVTMHVKVKDSFKRTLPSLLMLAMSVAVILLV